MRAPPSLKLLFCPAGASPPEKASESNGEKAVAALWDGTGPEQHG